MSLLVLVADVGLLFGRSQQVDCCVWHLCRRCRSHVAVPVVPVPDVDVHVMVIVAVLPSFMGRSKPG